MRRTAPRLCAELERAARDLAAGRLAEAARAAEALAAAHPRHPGVLQLVAILRHFQGDGEAAEAGLRAALAQRPDEPTYHDSLGIVLAAAGRLDEAVAAHERALELLPGFARARFNLGNALKRRGALGAAAAAYREALALDPTLTGAEVNLGIVLLAAGDLAAAEEVTRRALDRHEDAAVYNNLAAVLAQQGRPEEAAEALVRATETDPDFPLAQVNLGAFYGTRGEIDRALEAYRRATEARPKAAVLHLNLAFTLLQAGRWAEGFREYEWRWRNGGRPRGKAGLDRPLWDGEDPLAGRRLLLVDEQGLGDTIHFLRYAAHLAARGAEVVAECAPPLARLAATCPGVAEVIVGDDPPPEVDLQVPLASLPRLLATDLDSVPAEVPYLAPAPRPRREAEALLEELRCGDPRARRVGFVWAGNPDHPADLLRSCPVEAFATLARVPGVRLASLQFGPRGADLARLDAPGIVDLGPHLGDFADTAAALERLDLVVTVDTSMAHLAGALARPVWTLLGPSPDWRWLAGRDDTPWYPTMRLFRQATPGDWGELLERVAVALAGFKARQADAA